MKIAVKMTHKQWEDLYCLLHDIAFFEGKKFPAKYQRKCAKYHDKIFFPVYDAVEYGASIVNKKENTNKKFLPKKGK